MSKSFKSIRKPSSLLALLIAVSVLVSMFVVGPLGASAQTSEVALGAPTFVNADADSAYDAATGKVSLKAGNNEGYAIYDVQTNGAFSFEADVNITAGAFLGLSFGASEKTAAAFAGSLRFVLEEARIFAGTSQTPNITEHTYTKGTQVNLKIEVDANNGYKAYVDGVEKLTGTIPEGSSANGYIGLTAGWAFTEFSNVKLVAESDAGSSDTSSDAGSSDVSSDAGSSDVSSDDTSSDEENEGFPVADYADPVGPAIGLKNFTTYSYEGLEATPVPVETKDGILLQSDSNFTGMYPGIGLTSERVKVDGLEIVYRYDGFNGDGDDGDTSDMPQIRFALSENPDRLSFWSWYEGTCGDGFMVSQHIYDDNMQFFEGVQMDSEAGTWGEYVGQQQYLWANDAPAGSIFVLKFEYVGDDDMKITVNGVEIPGDFKAYRAIAEENDGMMWFNTCADLHTTAIPKPMIEYTLISIDGRAVSPLQLETEDTSSTTGGTTSGTTNNSGTTSGSPITGAPYSIIPVSLLAVSAIGVFIAKKRRVHQG